jgi:D-sedoheptulose 7-phosphate isomerase
MDSSASGGRFAVRSDGVSDDFVQKFISESITVLSAIDRHQIQACAEGLASVRDAGGRLFVLGVGGSAGHASHAVNDFRKICGLESYAPTDNVSELTARTNDEGWDTTFEAWLTTSRVGPNDGILVFSVGGGSVERQVSVNLVRALELGRERGARIFGIVGRDGGFTAQVSDACVVIPPLFDKRITPHTEGLCAVIWHLLVSHPLLAASETKWESVTD